MMPDVASSTLFGRDWIINFFAELTKLKRSLHLSRYHQLRDNPPSHDSPIGVFYDTEQWLWATNRFLRKLLHAIRLEAPCLLPGDT